MCFFWFNGKATTVIYTHWHTPSPHDALPIYDRPCADLVERRGAGRDARQQCLHHARVQLVDGAAVGPLRGVGHLDRVAHARGGQPVVLVADAAHGRRSEEHTSELQSLMRISYAVLCLKKKNTKHTYQTITN